ncbi:MAG: metal-dependent hydrolase [Myxococcota bacterium]
MANFQTHMVGAVAVGVVATSILTAAELMEPTLIGTAVGLTALGGLFPDVDSDNSDSIELVFSVMGLAVSMPLLAVSLPKLGLILSVVVMGLAYGTVRYVLIEPFRRFTVHRGIFHSVPMAAATLAGLTALVHYGLGLSAVESWMFGALFLLGFLTHLVLDELYSVDLANQRLKRSAGTAVKFFKSDDAVWYGLLYLSIPAIFWIAPSAQPFLDLFPLMDFHLLPPEELIARLTGAGTR